MATEAPPTHRDPVPNADHRADPAARARLGLRRRFTTPGVHPYDEVAWERRAAGITGEGGQSVFAQDDVEVPKDWSQLATNVVASKYFRGALGSPARETSVRQLLDRVVTTLRRWGEEEGYFADAAEAETFEAELTHLLVRQKVAFNSPVWFNVGTRERPQCSACQPWDALVSTPEGMVPIGRIVEEGQVGREVYDAHGTTRVVAVKANGVRPVVRVRLRNGSFVEATPDHVVRAVDAPRATPRWARVDELRLGMRLHLHPHRARVAAAVPALVPAGAGRDEADALAEAPVDARAVCEAALAGAIQAADRITIADPGGAHGAPELELVDDPAGFLERWGLGWPGDDGARVPDRLWGASHDEVAAYLRAVFVRDAFEARWSEGIQLLLNVLGIHSQRVPVTGAGDAKLFELRFAYSSERARFAELVGFDDPARQRALLDAPGASMAPDLCEEEIVAIEPIGEREVYDIQTESGEYLSNNVAVHNCFILSVEDEMESILRWISTEGMIFKGGSGSGINLSTIRSSRELLSGGGTASGPVSFMRGADGCAGAIKSGGTTRRAAKMVVLNCDHPDIMEFVRTKAEEEKKAWALGEMGYDMSINGEAWQSIQFQNANNSVRVKDEFMYAVEAGGDWHTQSVTTGEVLDTMRARDLMRAISEAAWVCGDPGMQYDTTINRWHTCPNSGRINASNPCSEYMHIDNSACNLASLNLMRFVDENDEFLVDDLRQAVDVTITAMDIIVSRSGYPTEAIAHNARAYRQLGLGYANLGALLMSRGLAYDSDAGRAYAGAVTALMTGRAYAMSTRLAERMGAFDGYAPNAGPMQGVMRMHQRQCDEIAGDLLPERAPLEAAREAWGQAVERGAIHGFRNAQASVLAPTGTIGFMMDCDTTGVEPDIALVKYKRLVGGGVIKIVNNTVPRALRRLGYDQAGVDAIVGFIDEHETIEGAPGLRDEHLPVFDCAFTPANGSRSIHYRGHIRMMGAVQPFISGAISKTVNMPSEATAEEIAAAYTLAWREGVKALAIYRDGSKRTQPLSTGKRLPAPTEAARPTRRRLPDTRQAVTHHFSIADHDGYITVGKYEDGSPGEVFMKMAKQGSTVSGLMDSLAICMSLALQHGVPLQVMADKLSHMRFDPSGFTGNPDIPMAKSIVDYVVRWLGGQFLSEEEQRQVGVITAGVRAEAASASARASDDDDEPLGSGTSASAAVLDPPAGHPSGQTELPLSPRQGGGYTFRLEQDGAICGNCGWTMIRSGTCYKCENCGSTSGCS